MRVRARDARDLESYPSAVSRQPSDMVCLSRQPSAQVEKEMGEERSDGDEDAAGVDERE
jgi:hypothetical protein